MKSDPCAFTGLDASGHVNLIVMAYVDDLVVSGESASVRRFFQGDSEDLQVSSTSTTSLLIIQSSSLAESSRSRRSGQITMEFLQKFIDNLLGLFKVTAKVTTNGVKIPTIKKDRVKCDKENHSLFRTAVGKILWMSQLRDDIKSPSQGVVQIFVKSPGIRLRQSQASSQAC